MSVDSNFVAYDTATLNSGVDQYDLTGFTILWDTAFAVLNSQTFTVNQFRSATLSINQYMSGTIVGQNLTWKFQVSPDAVTWYNLAEVYGATAPEKTLTGTAASPINYSYPIPISTPFLRVVASASSTMNAVNTLTVTMARLTLTPTTMLQG